MKKKFIIIIVLGLIIVGAGFIFFRKSYAQTDNHRQAVFMTNGQVYFGYVSKPSDQLVALNDVYYLKTQDLSQEGDTAKKKIILMKLGQELHNPENTMFINRDQILYIQDLSPESKINEAIAKYNSPSPNPSY